MGDFKRLLAVVVLALGIVMVPGAQLVPAFAHCPAGGGHQYVAGGNGNHDVDGVRTMAGWVASSNVCDSGASYSISIVHGTAGSSNYGWIQVGWRYRDGYSRPYGYCERRPNSSGFGSYALTEYTVPQAYQAYAYRMNDSSQFLCRIAGVTRRVTHENWLGFDRGGWVPVQAEAHGSHVQLGRIAPDWVHFKRAKSIKIGDSTWTAMHVNNVNTDDPVWNFTVPTNRGFGVNTDANH